MLKGRGAVKVAASGGCGIARNDGKLGMRVHDGVHLERGSIGQDLGPHLRLLNRLLLKGRGAVEVAASSGGGVAGDDGKLRVEEGDGEVTQGARIGKNLTALGEELVEVCGEESDRRMGRGRHFW